MLENRGYNFSLGLAQVNRYNLRKYGLVSYEKAFETCPNLQAASRILAECHERSGDDWGKSFSCYYSGDFVTGYRHGYVQKIHASMRAMDAGSSGAPPIDVVVMRTSALPGLLPTTASMPPSRTTTGPLSRTDATQMPVQVQAMVPAEDVGSLMAARDVPAPAPTEPILDAAFVF
jgi:type IV secretion system protein VirB1